MSANGPARNVPLLVIAGPTACSKTELALRVGEAVPSELVSADSMQIYRYMDIGTAKPTRQQRARVAIHLVDCVDPCEPYTVADFQAQAQAAIADIHARGRLPVLCGGTGLYINAVVHHFDFPPHPGPEQEQIRARLQQEAQAQGPTALHKRLMQLDPQAAATIGDADTKRIVRALEVIEATGRAFSDQRRIDEMPEVVYNSFYFVVARPRQVLYGAIEQRVDDMLQMGWLAEVQSLRERGCTRRDQAMQAIGYRHLLAHLEGDLDYQEAVRLIKRDTRRFAKRQLTWFRAESRRRLSGDRTGESAAFRWLEWATADEFQACVQQAVDAARRIYQP